MDFYIDPSLVADWINSGNNYGVQLLATEPASVTETRLNIRPSNYTGLYDTWQLPADIYSVETRPVLLIEYDLVPEDPFCGDDEHSYPVGDLNQDCHVDLADLALFAAKWLECSAPGCP